MKRKATGAVLAAVFAAATAAVLLAGRADRPPPDDWERVKADVGKWMREREAYEGRVKAGDPADPAFEDALNDRIRVLMSRYERVRKW